jgi:hypothetical protein
VPGRALVVGLVAPRTMVSIAALESGDDVINAEPTASNGELPTTGKWSSWWLRGVGSRIDVRETEARGRRVVNCL